MLKIVKNTGQCKAKSLKRCKYLLYTDEFSVGELYAKIRLEPIFWYIIAKITGKKKIILKRREEGASKWTNPLLFAYFLMRFIIS